MYFWVSWGGGIAPSASTIYAYYDIRYTLEFFACSGAVL